MKRYVGLVFVLCLLPVGCGGEPALIAGRTEAIPAAAEPRTRLVDGAVMVYVPAGDFLMGSTDEQIEAILAGCDLCERAWYDDEKPQHAVYVDAFWIDRTEVTNAQYRRCVDAGVCDEPGCWDNNRYNAPDQPVVCLDWEDAQAYAASVGGRLPTAAEWEKAARGTDGRIYPWGNEFDCERGNFDDVTRSSPDCDGYVTTAPAGSYPAGASPYGALDMAGNVYEWVADWYDVGYHARSTERNPHGPDSGIFRVVQGGSFHYDRWTARCASRTRLEPHTKSRNVGFRVVVARDPGSLIAQSPVLHSARTIKGGRN